MSFEQKPGYGAAFKPKQPRENGPNFTGFLRLKDGSVVGLSLFVKQDKAGKKYLSISHDEREGEYQAKKNGWPIAGAAQSKAEPNQQSGFGRKRDDDEDQRSFGADLDDDFPF